MSPSRSLKFSFVILNWNSGEYIIDCLRSVSNQKYENFEIILVDNGSSTDNFDKLSKIAANYGSMLIRLERNTGFSVGMNIGIKASTGDIIVALNSDAFIRDDFCVRVSDIFHNHVRLGFVAIPVFKWKYGSEINELSDDLWSIGCGLNLRGSVAAMNVGSDQRHLLGGDGSIQVFGRSLYEDLIKIYGYFYNISFGSYGEDLNVYLRAYSLGYFPALTTKTCGWHIGSASSSGRLGYGSKPSFLKSMIIRNKWTNIYSLPLSGKIISFIPSIAEDILRLAGRIKLKDYLLLHLQAIKSSRDQMVYRIPKIILSPHSSLKRGKSNITDPEYYESRID